MGFNLPETEEKILKTWKEKEIFKKTLEKTKKGEKFVFFEGPPFANGLPGIHHLLARAFKDIILRFKTMQGFYVERKAGWDTHGLPTEMAAEKKLGISNKRDIEKLGVEKFVQECKNNVFSYKKEWEEFTERIGFWVDLENAYVTCSNEYIESIWWILKQIWDKGLLYEDYKVVPYCPRCGTSLSSHEVAQGYKKVKENSVYIKLKIKGQENTYFLAWTTTPWTLPANVALAINPELDYVKVRKDNEFLILAKGRLSILAEYEEIQNYKGKELLNIEYEPLYEFAKPDKRAYFIVPASFVSLEDGTGIVHLAPAFGEDDMAVAKKEKLPVLHTVNEEGKFKNEILPWAGIFVKDADLLIIEELKSRNLLLKVELYEHDYPFCWRCKTPLLYYAKNSWFIRMTEVKKELIKNSEKINWEPVFIKKGRFGEWLKEVKDWNLSRERYWGTPLPVWRCENCKEIKVIESIKEIEELSGKKLEDLHKPYIDEAVFECKKCKGKMKRVSEVIDCWFDSGSMPFAQWHYPFENKEKIDKKLNFPADFIAEGMDQTRGWFYTLLAISTLLNKGTAYKNVICLGLILDARGQKMSKSRGNIIDPKEVINKFGADCARMYFYTLNAAGESKKFDFKDMASLYRRFFDILWQSYNFYETYALKEEIGKIKPKNILDRWIVSKLENLNLQIIKNLEKYDIVLASRFLIDFADDLSNWYIRRSRGRFKDGDKNASGTLQYVLFKISKLIAPFTPFFAEELYSKFGENESVHLEDYPKPEKKLIDEKLEEKMRGIREAVVQGLAERAKAGVKVRQPLKELRITNYELREEKELLELIKDEVNVKEVSFGKELVLNLEISEELKKEGEYRELVRNINGLRKEMGLTPNDFVIIESDFKVENKEALMKEVKAKDYILKPEIQNGVEITIGDNKYHIIINKNYGNI
jgi:isoleucyl-tRNA synthetase